MHKLTNDLPRRAHVAVAGALAAAVALLFLGAPHGGDFYWSDAPRHALNGVFIKDLVVNFPWRDPAGFAYDYYARYPALTILFYPPLFYAISAPFYALLGVSHETALLVVFLHYVAYAWGCYRLGLYVAAPWLAFLYALLMIVLPEVAFWGRQVMLEVPALAFAVWSAVAFVGYLRGGQPTRLYVAAALLVLAMYTKISVGFMAVAMVMALFALHGLKLSRDRRMWAVGVLSTLALVPLVLMTLKFGQANVQSVTGLPDAEVSRATLSGWLWYARQWPGQMGWPLVVAAAVAACYLALSSARGWVGVELTADTRRVRAERVFWLSWFFVGYFYFSSIDLKEARHSVFLLPPMVLAVAGALHRVRARSATIPICILVMLTAVTAGLTGFHRPVFYVHGYSATAAFIAQHAPQNSVVMFSGYRDGSFTFNMRAREDRPDLSVFRADKLLLNVAVERQRGVQQKMLSEEEIGHRINRLGVHYVVAQPGFWTDLEVMRRFEAVLRGPQFEEVARIATPANHASHEKVLVVYRNLGQVATGPIDLRIDLPIIGRTVEGATGARKARN